MDQKKDNIEMNYPESFTYVVKQNNYTITKKNEVKQVGGDWYNMFTSLGEVRVNGDLINKLVKAGKDCHQIEKEGKKINDTFTLSGAFILKRGTPFGNNIVFGKENLNIGVYDEGDEELFKELQDLTRSYDELSAYLSETQDKVKEVSKKILSKRRKKK